MKYEVLKHNLIFGIYLMGQDHELYMNTFFQLIFMIFFADFKLL